MTKIKAESFEENKVVFSNIFKFETDVAFIWVNYCHTSKSNRHIGCTCLGSLGIKTASNIVSIDEIAKESTGNVTIDDILPMYMPMH